MSVTKRPRPGRAPTIKVMVHQVGLSND